MNNLFQIFDIEQNEQFISNQNIMPYYFQFEILDKKFQIVSNQNTIRQIIINQSIYPENYCSHQFDLEVEVIQYIYFNLSSE